MKNILFSEVVVAPGCAVRKGVIAAIHFRHLRRETLFGVVSIGMVQEEQQLLFETTAFDVDGIVPAGLCDDEVADFLNASAAGGLKLLCINVDGVMHFEIQIAENLVLQGRSRENTQLFFQPQQHTEAQVSER